MTTKVEVHASCDNSTQVRVIRRTLASNEETVLQNGDSRAFYVHDEISVTVIEEQKPFAPEEQPKSGDDALASTLSASQGGVAEESHGVHGGEGSTLPQEHEGRFGGAGARGDWGTLAPDDSSVSSGTDYTPSGSSGD